MDLNRYEELKDYIRTLGNVAIAFSGGVDSTFLLKAAYEALGNKTVAITIKAPFHLQWEINEAIKLAEDINVKQIILEEKIMPEIKYNPNDRCYICKKKIFQKIIEYCINNNIDYVLDGSNIDDTKDYRPGLKALKELNVLSPLMELKFTKNEIRDLSKRLNLKTWNKPAYACILSRIQYGQEVTVQDLRMIENSECYLIKQGFHSVRVRMHGKVARIEIPSNEMEKILDVNRLRQINQELKKIGFSYVTLDLEGYRMGSQNEVIL
ncbi:MAG: ATP-dependent sacrificial sulfur transferase LarE [Eubacteriaceae bacterium]